VRIFNSFNITLGTCIRLVSIAVLVTLIVLYVQFQARNILLGPTITLSDTPATIQHERTLTLSGRAGNIVKLTVNGREIHTNERGEFTQALVLENGYTVVTLEAQDRFGRGTTLTREYVYVGG
jgi:hypothetical protein